MKLALDAGYNPDPFFRWPRVGRATGISRPGNIRSSVYWASALGLYIDDRASLGRAARIAGISVPAFLDELGKRKIAIHYDQEDLASDLRTLESLEQKGK